MAVLYVAEFSGLVRVNSDQGQIVNMPPIAEQVVAIGGSSTQCTNAFNALTKVIRVTTDAICSIAVGANPTATTSKARMGANTVEYFAVAPNAGYKIAVISNT